MYSGPIPLVRQVGRVPSMRVPLDRAQEARFQRLLEDIVLIDMHEHPVVLPEAPERFGEYLRGPSYAWGYEAVRAGGWGAVCTANAFRAAARSGDMSFVRFEDVVDEVAEMVADAAANPDQVALVHNAGEIEAAHAGGVPGFLPTVEHLGIGHDLRQIDVLYALGVRLAGLTYAKRNLLGDGLLERTDAGLSELAMAAIARMNDLGMAVDLSHAGYATAREAIACSGKASSVPQLMHSASWSLMIRPQPGHRRRNSWLSQR